MLFFSKEPCVNNFRESVFLIVIGLFCCYYGMYFMKRNEKGTAAASFAAANFAMGMWNFLRAVKNMVPERHYLFVSSLTYLVIEFSAYTLFWFAYQYSVPYEKQNRALTLVLLIFPAATIVALLYAGPGLFALSGTKPLHVWDYLHVIYGYVLISCAAVLLVIRSISVFQQNKTGYMLLTTILIIFIIQNFARYINKLGYLPELSGSIDYFYDVCTFLLVNLAFFAMYTDINEILISQCRKTLFDGLDQPLFVFNRDDEFLTANQRARDLYGRITGVHLRKFMKYDEIFPPDVFQRLGIPRNEEGEQMYYLSNVKAGMMFFCTKQPVIRDYMKKEIGYRCTLFDLDSYNMLFKNMEANAYSDPLTGCLNASSFFMNIRVEMQSTQDQCLLVAVGLDNLAEINTALGHRAGDAYIAAAAQILRDVLPDSRIYRMESSTFAVIFPVSFLVRLPEAFSGIRSACSLYSKTAAIPLVISAGYAVIEDRNVDVNAYYATAFSNMMLDRRAHASV
jgi:FOG: GGDEF domain